MVRPLYAEAAENPENRPRKANAGLWYDKFCNVWPGFRSDPSLGEAKKQWIESVCGPVGEKDLIDDYAERLRRLTDSVPGGLTRVFETESRFVTGLGREHPVENGFAWHPTLGTPYLPGSSVKGVVRTWARWQLDEQTLAPEAFHRIFGSDPREDSSEKKIRENQAGSVIFLDAVPTGRPKLEIDVMTPHYGDYYSKKTDTPGDWISPNPIPFLTVAKEQEFRFGIVPRTPEHQKDCKLVVEWLESALSWLGAGAKTAVGYGRFIKTDDRGRDLRWEGEDERKQLEDATPLERRIIEMENATFTDADATTVISNLDLEDDDAQVDRQALIEVFYPAWSKGQLAKPHQTNTAIGSSKLKEYANSLVPEVEESEATSEVDEAIHTVSDGDKGEAKEWVRRVIDGAVSWSNEDEKRFWIAASGRFKKGKRKDQKLLKTLRKTLTKSGTLS